MIDALLLEPPNPLSTPPHSEMWCAQRKDGALGSGSIQDPLDCSSIPYPDIPVTSLAKGGSSTEAVVTTSTPHGFADLDMVTIRGVASSGGAAIRWSGTFQIYGTSSTTFKYTMSADPGESSASGTITANKERERFDAVLRNLPAKVSIHLGPGVFETKGFTSVVLVGCAQLKDGQRILGAGVEVTTVKLVGVSVPDRHYVALGGDLTVELDGLEVSDLTVDCNVAGQPVPSGQSYAKVSCGAVYATSAYARVTRLRVINFGTQTSQWECFVLAVGFGTPGRDMVNSWIEDCLLEQPGMNNVRETTCNISFDGEDPITGITGSPRACGLRRNFVNGQFQDRPVAIETITISGSVATVTTRTNHNRNNGDYVVISGALVKGTLQNAYNGSYPISNASGRQFTCTVVGYGGLSIPTQSPAGDMWVDRFTSRIQEIANITVLSTTTALITTTLPHNLRPPNSRVQISEVSTTIQGVTGPDNRFNGMFVAAPSPSGKPNEFQITANGTLDPNHQPDFSPPGYPGITGTSFQGLTSDSGVAAIVEGNRVFHAWIGGPYHDSYQLRDQWTRDNYYHDVLIGPYENLGNVSFTNIGTALVSLSITNNVVTAQTSQPHGLVPPDGVMISDATIAGANSTGAAFLISSTPSATSFTYAATAPNGPASGAKFIGVLGGPAGPVGLRGLLSLTKTSDPTGFIAVANTSADHGLAVGDGVLVAGVGLYNVASGVFVRNGFYNGSFVVYDVPSSTTFRYRLSGDPVNPLPGDTGFAAGYFGAIWQSKKLAYEGNVIELEGYHAVLFNGQQVGGSLPPIGIAAGSSPARQNPYTFLEFIARHNLVRHIDERYGVVDKSQSRGFVFRSCEKALVQDNVIDTDYTAGPVEFGSSGSVKSWYNQTIDGQPTRARDLALPLPGKVDDISSLIEDVQTLALL